MKITSVSCLTAMALAASVSSVSAFQLNQIGADGPSHYGVQCSNGAYFEMKQVGYAKQWGVIVSTDTNVPLDWRKWDSCKSKVRSANYIRSPGQAASSLCGCMGSN